MTTTTNGALQRAAERQRALADAKHLRHVASAPYDQFASVGAALKRFKLWDEAAEVWGWAQSARAFGRFPSQDEVALAQQAMCLSYERAGWNLDQAFQSAVAVLDKGGIASTRNQEMLGIGGGIYKRQWDAFRKVDHLQQSLTYYDRGWKAGGLADDGYTGINAAYVADVLAYHAETTAQRAGGSSSAAAGHRKRAQTVRIAIVAQSATLEKRLARRAPSATSPSDPWWIFVTLAEAHFGLARTEPSHYDQARRYLERALKLRVDAWMIETTARQLGALARMNERAPGTQQSDPRPWEVLDVLAKEVPGLRTELTGKVGLALSGGGFRASLFHIGVLARLAELDLLRHVEVISCVSGGSILGAMYYLSLRKMLESKRDEEIKRSEYIEIVRGLERDFLKGIQENNFRMRMLESFNTNLCMLMNRGTRTESLGRIMAAALYGPGEVTLDGVQIEAKDAEAGFRPADCNWRRRNKIPLLVLNATNLAGGHPWQFTPYKMGEPELSLIDRNPRLAMREFGGDRVALWRAVSASACVPVLFEPIRVAWDTNTQPPQHVDLVDGGVHDNQGTSALLANDCTLLLVSDASGQLANDAGASTSSAAVGLRSDFIVQERLRIALYEALESRRRGSLLRGMLFLHLRLGLDGDDGEVTRYGIPNSVQRRLSAIRTDLDVFHDAEALSLMVSGYRMAAAELTTQLPDVQTPDAEAGGWNFLGFEAKVRSPSPRLLALLDVSAAQFFKTWRAIPGMWVAGRVLLGFVLLTAFALLVFLCGSPRTIAVSSLAKMAVSAIVVAIVERLLRRKVPNWKKEVARGVLAFTGSALAWVHRKMIDPLYLWAGSRKRL